MEEKNVRDLLYGVNRLKAYNENDEFIGYVTNLDGVTCGIYFKQNEERTSTLFNFRKSLEKDNGEHVWLSIDYYGNKMKVKVTNELYKKKDKKVKKYVNLLSKLKEDGTSFYVYKKDTNERIGTIVYESQGHTNSYKVYRTNRHMFIELMAIILEGSEELKEKEDGTLEFTGPYDGETAVFVIRDDEVYNTDNDKKLTKKCSESLKDKLRRGENKAVFIKKTNEKVGYAAYFPYSEPFFGIFKPKGDKHERFASFYEGSNHFIEKDGVIEFSAILDSKAEEMVVKDIDYVDINEEIKKKEKLKMEWSNPNEKQDKKFIKFDDGKRRYELLPPRELAQVVDILMLGANKYGKDNWKKMDDEDADRIVGAVYRHFEAWRQGDKLDKESGENHLAHAITNLLFLLWRDNEERG